MAQRRDAETTHGVYVGDYRHVAADAPDVRYKTISLPPAERSDRTMHESRLATFLADHLAPAGGGDPGATDAGFREGLFRLLVRYPMMRKRTAADLIVWSGSGRESAAMEEAGK